MSLPKKKSRSLTVNNQQFRYVISCGKYDENWIFGLNVTVQIAHGEGSKLKVTGMVTRDFWLDFPYDIATREYYPELTPKDVATLIEMGIEKGWDPVQKGPHFILKVDNTFPRKFGIK